MRIRREGLNQISCELYENDILYLNGNFNEIKNSDNAGPELERISYFVMNVLGAHINPMAFLFGGEVVEKISLKDKSIFMEFNILNIGFEAIDFPENFDGEFDINKCVREMENGSSYVCDTEEQQNEYEDGIFVSIVFENINDVIAYARNIQKISDRPYSSLYLYRNQYYLTCDFDNMDGSIIDKYDYGSTDFKAKVIIEDEQIAYIEEHGKQIIKENALEILYEISEREKNMKKEDKVRMISGSVKDALTKYDTENVDIVRNEESGNVDIVYHSSNNSFPIVKDVCDAEGMRESDIKKVADFYNIGYCW